MGQEAELSERELSGWAHVNVIVAIMWFQCRIRASKVLLQQPPADTEAETCIDSKITPTLLSEQISSPTADQHNIEWQNTNIT